MLSLFTVGGTAALIGDHSHVATGTTIYYTTLRPFIWSSPYWFPLLVGFATVILAESRLRLRPPRSGITARQALAGVAAVVGMYVTTALLHGASVAAGTALIAVVAVIVWCTIGDGAGALCGVIVGIVGPALEIALVKIGVFAYNPNSDGLFGVGPFLIPLYFTFGSVAGMLGEFAVTHRRRQSAQHSNTATGAR